MPGHTCYHCKQWVEEGEAHDCWTTTEAALTADLAEDLREAWDRLRETAVEFGEQRIYASHSSIMFSRRSCYFFVRPKRGFLEVNVFLGRTVQAPQVRKVVRSSAAKQVHVLRITHRDEVESPVTDWLEEAYHYVETAPVRSAPRKTEGAKPTAAGTTTPARAKRAGTVAKRRKTAATKARVATRKKGRKAGRSKGR